MQKNLTFTEAESNTPYNLIESLNFKSQQMNKYLSQDHKSS